MFKGRSLLVAVLVLFIQGVLAVDLMGQRGRVSIATAAFESVTVQAGQTATLAVTAEVEFLWHIYSVKPEPEAYPTRFSVETEGVEFGGPSEPEPILGGDAGHELAYHEGKVTFRVPVTFAPSVQGRVKIRGFMHFMACDANGCEPPSKLPFSAVVTIEKEGAAKADSTEEVLLKGPNGALIARASIIGGDTLRLRVELGAVYHIYANRQPEGAVVTPTAIQLGKDSGATLSGKLIEPTPHSKNGEEEWDRYSYHEGSFELLQKFDAKPGLRELRGWLTYQACDASSCFDSTDLSFSLPMALQGPSPDVVQDLEPLTNAVNDLSEDVNNIAARVRAIEEAVIPAQVEAVAAPSWKLESPQLELGVAKTRAGEVIEATLTFRTEEVAEIGSPKDIFIDFKTSKRIKSIEATAATSDKGGLSHTVTLQLAMSELAKSGLEDQVMSVALPLDVRGNGFEMELNAVPFEVEFGLPNLWGWVLKALLAGLLALLTPCVFPMIPVTVSFFTKQAESQHRHAIVLPTVYAGGIIVSFVAIGAGFTAFFGESGAQILATNGFLQGAFGLLFVVFSLSLFGLFTLRPPAFLMSRAGSVQGKGGIGGTLGMGLLFSLTSFTCTAPLVGYILVDAAESNEWQLPIIGMLAFSAVLAIPFFFLALFPKLLKSMPKSGGWMNSVKVTLGFLELAFAFKFIGAMDVFFHWGFFTRELILWVWVLLFVMNGLYLLGIIRFAHDAKVDRVGPIAGAFAVVLILFGIYVQNGARGDRMPMLIEGLMPPRLSSESDGGILGWINHTKNDLAASTERARLANAPLFIDFTGFI